jgi:hypothetical protein
MAMGEKGDTSQATGGLGERLVREGGEGQGEGSSSSSGWGLSDMTDAVQDRVTDTAGGAVSGLRGKDDDKDED